MNDQNYIRKAVKLADDVWPWDFHKKETVIELSGYDRDALAAQLVKQMDDTKYRVIIAGGYSEIMEDFIDTMKRELVTCIASVKGPNRAMNTIRVIVDSKVLEQKWAQEDINRIDKSSVELMAKMRPLPEAKDE